MAKAKKTNRQLLFTMIYNVAAILEFKEIDTLITAATRVRKGGKYAAKDLEKGMKVSVQWPEDGTLAAGVVVGVEEFTVGVKFEDGEFWWLPIALITKLIPSEKDEPAKVVAKVPTKKTVKKAPAKAAPKAKAEKPKAAPAKTEPKPKKEKPKEPPAKTEPETDEEPEADVEVKETESTDDSE